MKLALGSVDYQITNPAVNPKVGTGSGLEILQLYLKNFIELILIAGGVVAFIILLIGSFEYIMAGGDKEETEKAKKKLTGALVGLVILFCVFAIIALVESIFGVSIMKFDIPVL
jgi:NADH:ubiquinone oxidoreductase subunit 6 (subunit J)